MLETLLLLILKRCVTLLLTLKNKRADLSRINEVINLIKKNTLLLLNFRGNTLISTVIVILAKDFKLCRKK